MKEKFSSRWLIATLKNFMRKSYLMIFLLAFTLSVAEAGAQSTVKGTITDNTGAPVVGVTVIVKGTTQGTITDANGTYSLNNVPGDATLVFSFIGMKSMEVAVNNQTTIDATMEIDAFGLDEVVAIGYGTRKKVNLTGAVSIAGKEEMENRPVGNVQQALQGLVPNLVITANTAGGEPGAEMSMSIRGLSSFEGSSNPYVLVDGIPMGLNDIDPTDVESITVLKDAASTAIYGARAAYGVILVTTKKGEKGANVNYSTNYGFSNPTIWPALESGSLDWAHALNDAAINAGGSPFYPEEALQRLQQNLDNPGSAEPMLPSDELTWNILNTGTRGVANDNLDELLVNEWAPKIKHNLSVSGGNDKINYYVSGGFYDEKGLMAFGDEFYRRYNIDAKISAKATDWLELSFLAKYRNGHENFPWNTFAGRSWFVNWIGKLKPGTPAKYYGTDIWTQQTRVEEWKVTRQLITRNQLVMSPRIVFEPIKGWVTNIELNYTSNNDDDMRYALQYPTVRPNGEIAYVPNNRASTQYLNTFSNNRYISPNIYSSYTVDIGLSNLTVMAGFQQELFEYNNMDIQAFYLLSDQVPSISTAVGETSLTLNRGPNNEFPYEKGHWATRSYFGRFSYNYADKYLLEANIRTDGSSRFEPGQRWGIFPSVSAGWVISKEDFFPAQDQINLLKLRGSYGTLGNQNVANYLYVPTLSVRQTNQWLFNNNRAWTVGTPNLTSVDLTWEQVATIDVGIDALLLNNRLGISLGAFESRTTNLVGPGESLPAVLGTSVPKKNEGEIMTRGWEAEISWKNRVSQDFGYQIRGVISDNVSTVVNYNNPTKLFPDNWNNPNRYYEGMVLGEIWGLERDGYYQSVEDVANHGIDQSYIYSGTWNPGDFKYVDQNDDGAIDRGGNTADDHGDLVLLGNSTPRLVYGLNLSATWKSFDISMLWQGIGKRQLAIQTSSVFRGPAAGPMHNNVLRGHLDYWRDESSPLGANTDDPYFPKPYAQFFAQNYKNYGWNTDHFLQDASFLRLKNIQIGYSLPSNVANKIFMKSARLYISGENLLTFTKMMFFDPEAYGGRWYGAGDAYPLSKTVSAGLNLNF